MANHEETGRKVELIKQITQNHPAFGVDKGWSVYTGGMTDDGHWIWENMLKASTQELSDFIEKIRQDKKQADINRKKDEEYRKTHPEKFVSKKDKRTGFTYNDDFIEKRRAMCDELKMKLLFGK